MDIGSRASADGRRRTLVEIVREHPFTCPGLTKGLPIAPPGASRDPGLLRVAALRDVRQPAQLRTCGLRRPEPLVGVDPWTGDARGLWQSRLDTLHIAIANGRKTR
jgi:hypothetical protein